MSRAGTLKVIFLAIFSSFEKMLIHRQFNEANAVCPLQIWENGTKPFKKHSRLQVECH